jgi:hypothetical protein
MVIRRFALVRSTDGAVVNVCVWDGVTEWDDSLPSITVVECPEEVGPGWSYDGGAWNPPPADPPPADPPPED